MPDSPIILTTDQDVKARCEALAKAPFIAIDTEFMRERTYYPILCLIQISGPDKDAFAIDPVANPKLNLAPLKTLFKNKKITKVFHSGKQDLDIFYKLFNLLPAPFFDTQVAAMFCGYGDQVAYTALVKKILNISLDKTEQLADWAKRPLKPAMIDYALADVTHLCDIYTALQDRLKELGREKWVAEEHERLADTSLYTVNPDETWQRIKIRSDKRDVLYRLQQLAAWRETEAQSRDVPKGRILKDDALAELAMRNPLTPKHLQGLRSLSRSGIKDKDGKAVLGLLKDLKEKPTPKSFKVPQKIIVPSELAAARELLRLYLRIMAAENEIVPRLIAGPEELDAFILAPAKPHPFLKGWRNQLFGQHARALLQGKIALGLQNTSIKAYDTSNF